MCQSHDIDYDWAPWKNTRSYIIHAIDALRQRGNHLRRTDIAERGGEATISLGRREHPKITQRKFAISSILSPRSLVAFLVGLLSCQLAEPGWNDKAREILHIEKPSELRKRRKIDM